MKIRIARKIAKCKSIENHKWLDNCDIWEKRGGTKWQIEPDEPDVKIHHGNFQLLKSRTRIAKYRNHINK